jgi:hypothetical protein
MRRGLTVLGLLLLIIAAAVLGVLFFRFTRAGGV